MSAKLPNNPLEDKPSKRSTLLEQRMRALFHTFTDNTLGMRLLDLMEKAGDLLAERNAKNIADLWMSAYWLAITEGVMSPVAYNAKLVCLKESLLLWGPEKVDSLLGALEERLDELEKRLAETGSIRNPNKKGGG